MHDSLPLTSRSLHIASMRERVIAPIKDILDKSNITEQKWCNFWALSEYGELDTASLASRSALLNPSLKRIINSTLSKGLFTQDRMHRINGANASTSPLKGRALLTIIWQRPHQFCTQ